MLSAEGPTPLGLVTSLGFQGGLRGDNTAAEDIIIALVLVVDVLGVIFLLFFTESQNY